MNVTLLLTALTGFLVLALAAFFYVRPSVGLGLFIFSLPFERIGSYALNPVSGYPLLHPAQIIGAGLIGGYGLRWLAGKEKLSVPKSFWFLLAFLASAVVSAIMAQVQEVWSILVWLGFIATLFFVVANIINTTPTKLIRKAMVIVALVISIFGIYQLVGDLAGLPTSATGLRVRYTKEVLGFTRVQTTALEPLYYANYLFLPMFLLLALQMETGFDSKLEVVTLVLVFINFVITLSRGAYVSGIVGLLLLIILSRNRLKTWIKKTALPIAAILIASAAIVLTATTISINIAKPGQFSASQALRSFLSTKVFQTGSFTERARDQKLALKIWHEHPIFGVGIGGFGSAYYGCHVGKCVYRPNNQALEVLAEGGVVGFTAFHLFLVMLLYYGWRALKQTTGERRAMIAGLMAAEVAMVVQSQTFSGFLCCLTYTWGTLALLAGLSMKQDDKKVKADG